MQINQNSMSSHNATGKKGEALAKEYLEDLGYKILELNFKYEKAEIDIIALHKDVIVFIEVKTRRSENYGFPEEAVNRNKQNNLHRAAEGYLEENEINGEIRFDIISILLNAPSLDIYHIKDAFFPEDDE